MGLDCFWYHPDWTDDNDQVQPELVPDPDLEEEEMLVGGMLSGHGSGSFRGKMYEDFVEDVTGESLYQHEIGSHTVVHMAEVLREYNWDAADEGAWQAPETEQEYQGLVRMFEFYAEQGASLVGWW